MRTALIVLACLIATGAAAGQAPAPTASQDLSKLSDAELQKLYQAQMEARLAWLPNAPGCPHDVELEGALFRDMLTCYHGAALILEPSGSTATEIVTAARSTCRDHRSRVQRYFESSCYFPPAEKQPAMSFTDKTVEDQTMAAIVTLRTARNMTPAARPAPAPAAPLNRPTVL